VLKSREVQAEAVSKSASVRSAFGNARILAVIGATAALGGSIGSAAFNYFFTEKERTEIQQRALAVQQASLQVSEAAQRTSDEVKQITAARLEFEKEIHLLNTARSNFRDEIARVGGMNDSRRTENDSARTKFEMARQQRELIPSLLVGCFVVFPSELKAGITCNLTNNGTHTWRSEIEPVLVVDKTDEVFPNVLGKIHGPRGNRLPPGGKGSNYFQIDLNVPAKELDGKAFKITFNLVTDEAAKEQVRLASGGLLSPKHLNSLTSYTYVWRIWL